MAAALGLLAAERGRRTIVVEIGRAAPAGRAVRRARPRGRAPRPSCGRISGASRSTPTGRCWSGCRRSAAASPGRVLASSGTFQYFAAAAPGAKELISMVKIWQLTQGRRGTRGRAGGYDLVILDAPATGHALGMLALAADLRRDRARRADRRADTRRCGELLADPERSGLPGGRARRPRWPSPRRSSSRRACSAQIGRSSTRCRQRLAAAALLAPAGAIAR